MFRLVLALLAGFLLNPMVAGARPVIDVPPEDMETEATLVCNGQVLSVENTGLRREVSYPGVSPSDFVVRMKARVKTLHIFKGRVPAEFELTYGVLDPTKYPKLPVNAPEHISLQKDERYRFFLKPGDKENLYVGVLDGKIDDGFAVQTLGPEEKDAAPYLTKDEAIKIARNYLAVERPGIEFTGETIAYCQGGAWAIILHKTTSPTSDYAAITVRNDRTIDLSLLTWQDLSQPSSRALPVR